MCGIMSDLAKNVVFCGCVVCIWIVSFLELWKTMLVVSMFFNVIKGVYFETLHMWLSEGVGSVFGACCWFVLQ